jgi:hypothetical protein
VGTAPPLVTREEVFFGNLFDDCALEEGLGLLRLAEVVRPVGLHTGQYFLHRPDLWQLHDSLLTVNYFLVG